MSKLSKREFLKLSTIGASVFAAGGLISSAAAFDLPKAKNLTSMLDDVSPISLAERLARVEKAQRLMSDNNIEAIILEPGSAMDYFTGISWWRSERLTAIVIPKIGEIGVVTPHFEEPSVRESMSFGDDVRPWHEHENPFDKVASILADRGITSGKIGVEKTVRYFVVDGLEQAMPNMKVTSATPVTLGCRMLKSAHEIKLMAKANQITLSAYKHVHGQIKLGMTPSDIGALMDKAQRDLGGSGTWALILLGEASAYPHGSDQPQMVRENEVVLMDCGCSVHGYQSDISRTFTFGTPSKHQRDVWNLVKQGQELVMETAQIGTPAGQVDDAVRKLYEANGYGPHYKTPGLPHRTGHGIGMDGHEMINFVRGEETPLQSGMCFSNEPGLYIYGSFGVRLEDCLYMTDSGPKLFTELSSSIDLPFK
jgi:Xaa-Pro dipeptidase